MPNWCENDLYIYGARRGEIADAIQGSEGVIDFEKIVPMPAELKETTKGSVSSEAEILLGWSTGSNMLDWAWVKDAGVTTIEELKAYLVKRTPELPAIAEKMRALREQTGYSDWYEWSVANWGTKWNVAGGDHVDRGLAHSPDVLDGVVSSKAHRHGALGEVPDLEVLAALLRVRHGLQGALRRKGGRGAG